MVSIKLDPDLVRKLRDAVNSENHLASTKTIKTKGKNPPVQAYNITCAVLDRVEDTVDYLNSLKLNSDNQSKSAFDFYNFMLNASVLIDCLDTIAKVYDVDLSTEDSSCDVFNKHGSNNKGSDKRYFEYLRALSSVHPNDTDRYIGEYQSGEECSPFAVWDRDSTPENPKLRMMVYPVSAGQPSIQSDKIITVSLKTVFEYVKTRYELINKIIAAIKDYNKNTLNSFKNKPIKKESEFNDYREYLGYLKEETLERMGLSNGPHCNLDYAQSVFDLDLSDNSNQDAYIKYCNALKYAISFEHNRLQSMCSNGCENTGIKQNTKDFIEGDTLLDCIVNCSIYVKNNSMSTFDYLIEKLSDLDDSQNPQEQDFVRGLVLNAPYADFFKKYVSFNESTPNHELYILTQIALYLYGLEVKDGILNKNIPNSPEYR